MKQLITSIALLLLSSQIWAQPYFPFYKTGTSYYQSDAQKIFSLSVTDSTVQNEYKFAPNLHVNMNENELDCDASLNASWMGKKMIRLSDTLYYFINYADKPISLYTNSIVGQSWLAYSDTLAIGTFTHIKDSVISVFGVLDSIKIIKTAQQGANADSYQFEIWLSKIHGLIKTVNFYRYPSFKNAIFNSLVQPKTLTLISNSNTNLPIQNITWRDIYNYDIGDEFHYLTYQYISTWNNSNNTRSLTADTCRSIYKVYQKNDMNDSILYSFTRRQFCTLKNNVVEHSSIKVDTIDVFLKHDSLLDRLPGVTSAYPPNDIDKIFTITLSKNTLEKYTVLSDVLFKRNDTCASIAIDAYNEKLYYYKGAGGPYYENTYKDIFDAISHANHLIYYKKAASIWGNPWPENVGVAERMVSPKFTIYPNPATNWIHINNPSTNNFKFTLLNILGEVVFENNLTQGENSLNIGLLKPEMYLYQIKNNNFFDSGKVIIGQ